ncbi:MAG: glycosyltransferase family 2 protein, partial [Methanobacteriaceae archaeon]
MILSIVIPNYNGKKFLKTCFDSIIKSQLTSEYNMEIIVIDNGSNDGSQDFIKSEYISKYNKFNLIENKDNLGFAKAVNQGIKSATGEFVFLLNNDVELDENCINNLLNYAKSINNKYHNFFAIGAKMLQFNNRNFIDDAGDEYNLLAWTKKVGENKIASKYSNNREIFSACAGAALYKRSIFEEIGYFDEN